MSETTLKRRTSDVLIMQPDDIVAIGEQRRKIMILEAQVEAAREELENPPADQRIGDGGPALGQLEEHLEAAKSTYNELITAASERAVVITVRALGRTQFRDMKAQHPARRDEDGNIVVDDQVMGVNTETMSDVLLPASIVAPAFGSETEKTTFIEDLGPDAERVFATAFWLNDSAGVDPKDLLPFDLRPSSTAT